MINRIKQLAASKQERLIGYRRYFHENPELSFQETRTAEQIRGQLEKMGVEIRKGTSGNSVVGVLDTHRPGKTIAFRADIDAVPVQETTGLPYASHNPGAMHACGHDAHTAVLLCLAELLSEQRDRLSGRVVFLFQQGEECFPGGAKTLVEEGALDDVDEVYCYHASSIFPLGDVNTANNLDLARIGAVGGYTIRIKGQGGHAGTPHKTRNPILAGAAMVPALVQAPGRYIDPAEFSIVTVSHFSSGTGEDEAVIPDTAELGGAVCDLKEEVHEKIFDRIRSIANRIAEGYDCTAEIDTVYGYPAVINTERENRLVQEAVEALGYNLKIAPPSMAGDDFSYYLQKKPGAYFTVGMGDPDHPEKRPPHHSGGFVLDEKGLLCALEMFLYVYLKTTNQTL